MSKFESYVAARLSYARRGAKLWSTAHHLAGYGAIISGAAATLVGSVNLAADDPIKTVWTAALAGLTTVLTAAQTFGGFERKWRTNRRTRTALERLAIDLEYGDASEMRERLYAIITDHDLGIDCKSAP